MAAWVLVILAATSVPLPTSWSRWAVPGFDTVIHAGLYGVLGWLVGTALNRPGARGWRLPAAAVVAMAAFGAGDEAHQAWTPGRVPALADWLADVTGATVGLAAGTWFGRRDTGRTRSDGATEGGRSD